MSGLFFLGVGLALATEHPRHETVNLLVFLARGFAGIAVVGFFGGGVRAICAVLDGVHFGYLTVDLSKVRIIFYGVLIQGLNIYHLSRSLYLFFSCQFRYWYESVHHEVIAGGSRISSFLSRSIKEKCTLH